MVPARHQYQGWACGRRKASMALPSEQAKSIATGLAEVICSCRGGRQNRLVPAQTAPRPPPLTRTADRPTAFPMAARFGSGYVPQLRAAVLASGRSLAGQ